MKYKVEISLLLLSIALYVVSTICYSYQSSGSAVVTYPYRTLAVPLICVASVFLVVAGFLYSKQK